MSEYPAGRIGYYWSCKKSLKLDASVFKSACLSHGYELVKIDFDRDLEEQGPFVAIVHKLFDFLLLAENGDKKAADVLESFQTYVKKHPDIVLIDSLEDIRRVTDRFSQYMSVTNEFTKQDGVFIPAFVELTSLDIEENMSKLKSAGIEFPILCKPSVAHGVPSHPMCIVFCEAGLKDITTPCVAQMFINHNAVLYKLFTIGNKYVMIQRPSLKNFQAGDSETIYFNSHDVSKTHSSSALCKLDNDEPKTPLLYPEKEKTDYIVEVLNRCLGLHLLGIDLIIDNKTGQYALIDINYFPGYYEIDNFFILLTELIVGRLSLKSGSRKNEENFPSNPEDARSTATNPNLVASSMPRGKPSSICMHTEPRKPKAVLQVTKSHFHSVDCLQEDSGIETSDSCDERNEPCGRSLRQLHYRSMYSAS